MRSKPADRAEAGRILEGEYATESGSNFGAFSFKLDAKGPRFHVIASEGDAELGIEWEHVSVSLPDRCPTWSEMHAIKQLFWEREECVVQFHPPESTYVSNHRFCLHMWRPTREQIPLPPSIAVGIREIGVIDTPAKLVIARAVSGRLR